MQKPDACIGCPLYHIGFGPIEPQLPQRFDEEEQAHVAGDARLYVVADHPESGDVEEHAAFQSQAGRLLRIWLREAGVRSTHCYMTYLCKCAPPDGKKPSQAAYDFCKHAYFNEEWTQSKPGTWLIAGKESCKHLLNEDLSASAGYFFEHPVTKKTVMPIAWAGDVIKNPRDTGITQRHIGRIVQPVTSPVDPTKHTKVNPRFSDLAEWMEKAKKGKYIVFDTETPDLIDLRMQCIGIADEWGNTISVPWNAQTKHILSPLFEDPNIIKYAYNVCFDVKVMHANGVTVNGIFTDIMRLVQIDDLGSASKKLEVVTPAYVAGVRPWKRKGIEEGLLVYNSKDTYYEWFILRELYASLYGTRRWKLFERTINLERVVFEMMDRGFQIDVPLLHNKMKEVQDIQKRIEDEWAIESGGVNPRSPTQLKKLFTARKVKFWRNHEGKESTDEASLKKMMTRETKENRALLDLLLRTRRTGKMASTYLAGEYIPRQDGALHPNIKITGTVAGRPSFSQPNLGNIPKDAKDIFKIRDLFVARPGYKLVQADWSQAETRITAILADEQRMLDAWTRGEDIHRVVAGAIFKVAPEKVTKDQRNLSKRIVYGLSYGAGASKVSEVAEITLSDARKLIERFSEEFPNYFQQLRKWGDAATVDGYLVNPFGRVHNFTGDRVYTQARNFTPQSTVADMMNIVLCQLWEAIQGKPMHILLQVYDQIIMEVKDDPAVIAEARQLLEKLMNQPWPELNGHVIPADASEGYCWGEL